MATKPKCIQGAFLFSKTILKARFPSRKIIKTGGIEIGLFGLGVPLKGLVDPLLTDETKHMDAVPIAREMVQEPSKKRCHLILCLSHLGWWGDQELAQQSVASI